MENQTRVNINHYKTLGIAEGASQTQVKQAYRQLAKQFHPDSQNQGANHEKIASVNAAYEVLGDVSARQQYDVERQLLAKTKQRERTSRTVDSQNQYRKRKSRTVDSTTIEQWLRKVFNPIDRLVGKIIQPLKAEVRSLSADPFDDELMAAFQSYVEACRENLEKAQTLFKSMPNPAGVAGGAANMYYCLNQLEDGIEEIERFTYTYDEHYLHTGQELFRISTGLRKDAKAEIKAVL
ncbi:J domain-containing protein [cf. Phormidesmis sp. LEGE 11477]|uniref:J domain-containing protein n=1 Tax=cf. Phormidesmis sp. LEGE 11477 TaxID=1828680 RepID=UPI001881105B|nr:J domain-containing protein [cf. Phormidesmis sp. LEGE 11477]MBE9060136.1 J domain-containing protein [cf. Phormidesmis sp. LEGE 11477]